MQSKFFRLGFVLFMVNFVVCETQASHERQKLVSQKEATKQYDLFYVRGPRLHAGDNDTHEIYNYYGQGTLLRVLGAVTTYGIFSLLFPWLPYPVILSIVGKLNMIAGSIVLSTCLISRRTHLHNKFLQDNKSDFQILPNNAFADVTGYAFRHYFLKPMAWTALIVGSIVIGKKGLACLK